MVTVMIGGNLREDNLDIWETMVHLAGGVEVEFIFFNKHLKCELFQIAKIGVITAANEDPVSTGRYYVDMFMRYRVGEVVWIPVMETDPDSVYLEDNVNMIQNMTGVFFGGGDPWRLAAALMETRDSVARLDTPVMSVIRDMWRQGELMLGGTSAGIMALTDTVVINGGRSYESLVSGSWDRRAVEDADHLTYDSLGGLQIMSGVLIDAHFSEKGRQGRLIRLAHDIRVKRVVGVDEERIVNIGSLPLSSAQTKIIMRYPISTIHVMRTLPWSALVRRHVWCMGVLESG